MEYVVIERDFDQPTSYDGFVGPGERDPGCNERYRVSYAGSFVSCDGRRMLCLSRAPDAESVRIPSRLNGVPFSRIWTADVLCEPGFEGEPLPCTLATRAGGADREPYRAVSVVQGWVSGSSARDMVGVARALLDGAKHLFSYCARGGELYVGVFERASSHCVADDGLSAWSAVVRTITRRPVAP